MPRVRNTKPSDWPPKREPHFSDEESRERYRTDVLGLPGPVDRWVARVTAGYAQLRAEGKIPLLRLAWNDVRCDFTMLITAVGRRSWLFSDELILVPQVMSDHPEIRSGCRDTYTLHIQIRCPETCKGLSSGCRHHYCPCLVLEQYVGQSTDLQAPDWTRWRDKERRSCVLNRGFAAKLAWHLAFYLPNLAEVRIDLLSMSIRNAYALLCSSQESLSTLWHGQSWPRCVPFCFTDTLLSLVLIRGL